MKKGHEYAVDVRWGEMDALGHVNNAVYLNYFEAARIEWMTELGYISTSVDTGPVVLNSNCSYRVALVYPCAAKVETQLIKVGNSSFTLSQNLVGRDDGVLYTESDIICVWVDRTTGRPVPVPDYIRSQLIDASPINK